MMIKNGLVSIIFILSVLITGCGEQQIAGGSTGTEVSAVVGKILTPDNLPAVNAQIKLRTSDFLPDSAKSDSYVNNRFSANTVTDSFGVFKFDSVPPDTYYIDITQDSLAVSIGLNVERGTPRYDLPEKQLSSMVAVSGYVSVESQNARGRIQVRGMDTTFYPDENGHFDIRVPSGCHTLIFDAESKDGMWHKPQERKFDTGENPEYVFDETVRIESSGWRPPPPR